jgi:hypothetical protein
MSFKFITTVAGHTWPDMPSICFIYIVTEQRCRLVGYAKKVKGLTQQINCKA